MTQIEQDAALIQDYLTECEEFLQQLDQDLVTLESSPDDSELLNRIFRAFHTIKGTSGFLNFTHIVELTHHAEDVLNVLREGERKVTRRVMDTLLAALDQLREMIGDVRGGITREYEIDDLVSALHHLLDTEEDSPSGNRASASEAISAESAPPAATADASVEATLVKSSPDSRPKELTAKASNSAAAVETTRTIRVDVTKLDELINLVGELVLERNRLLHLSRSYSDNKAADDRFEAGLLQCAARLSFITDELQTAGLRTRMVPVEAISAASRAWFAISPDRSARKSSWLSRGKTPSSIKPSPSKSSIHSCLSRNSPDHGVELPHGLRVERGKPGRGTVRVEARQEGDNIVIEIADDGAGMDHNRIARESDRERRHFAGSIGHHEPRAKSSTSFFFPASASRKKSAMSRPRSGHGRRPFEHEEAERHRGDRK